jgi:hypothetical protein
LYNCDTALILDKLLESLERIQQDSPQHIIILLDQLVLMPESDQSVYSITIWI